MVISQATKSETLKKEKVNSDKNIDKKEDFEKYLKARNIKQDEPKKEKIEIVTDGKKNLNTSFKNINTGKTIIAKDSNIEPDSKNIATLKSKASSSKAISSKELKTLPDISDSITKTKKNNISDNKELSPLVKREVQLVKREVQKERPLTKKVGMFDNINPKILNKKGSLQLDKGDKDLISSKRLSDQKISKVVPISKEERELEEYRKSLSNYNTGKKKLNKPLLKSKKLKFIPVDNKNEKIALLKKEIINHQKVMAELSKGVPSTESLIEKYSNIPILDVKKLDVYSTDVEHISREVTDYLYSNELRSMNNLLSNEVKRNIKEKVRNKLKKEGKAVDNLKFPKTLNGLINLAKNQGIKIKGITIKTLLNTSGKYAINNMMNKNLKSMVDGERRKYYTLKHEFSVDKLNSAKVELSKLVGSNYSDISSGEFNSNNILLNQNRQNIEFKTAFSDGSFTLKEALKKRSNNSKLVNSVVTEHKGDKTFFAKGDKENVVNFSPSQNLNTVSYKNYEAKAMLKNFSKSLRDQVINYKSPFSRVKMELEPGNLGSVNVTILNQGDKLHVNISSNPIALNMMALHQNQLKSDLSSAGLTGLNMSFNNSDSESKGKQNQKDSKNQSRNDSDESLDIFLDPELKEV